MPTFPFADRVPTPADHFRVSFFAAVLRLFDHLGPAWGPPEAVAARYPFLAGYLIEFAGLGLEELPAAEAAAWWSGAVREWELATGAHLPLRAVRAAAALDPTAEAILLAAGLTEEDARFGLVFEDVQAIPGQHRPTLALLSAWWRGAARSRVRRLLDLGLLQVVNPDAPRLEWAVQVNPVVWDALREETPESPLPGMRFRPPHELPRTRDLILPDRVREELARLPALLANGEIGAVAVRGPRGNGRRTTLAGLARALGRGVIEIHGPPKPDDARWKTAGPLAAATHALPVVVLDLAPGETVELPRPAGYRGPLGVVLGRHGGVGGPAFDRALTVTLEMPDRAARREHWRAALAAEPRELDELARGFRLSGGAIRRAAGLARTGAALAGRDAVTAADVRAATRTLNRQALDTLAVRLDPAGTWADLAVAPETARELADLEARCRHREALPASVGAAFGARLGPGVRAMFTGPSGTGKTLAARLLAAAVGADLYRLDLSALVSKYIGETEKNLHQALTLAEELDVMLLLDEGDGLLAPRTGVQSSTDRYANLETNFLLQRLEAYDGVLLITTNAADRIDGAFLRRIDVVVEFHLPSPTERWAIWQSHLPAGHGVDSELLREVSARCPLSGGQIRNTVLHAALLGLEDGGIVTSAHLEAAVHREYRKAGGVCPLRRGAPGPAGRG